MPRKGARKSPKKRAKPKAKKTEEQTPDRDRRYVLLELACAEKKCDPCTYPDCQRFTRETGKRPPITTRMFELRSVEALGRIEPDRRYVVVELACKEKKCNPCVYPYCQRYVREFAKKKRFTTPLFELSREDWKKMRKSKYAKGEEVAAEAS